jgi:hypothetical protein
MNVATLTIFNLVFLFSFFCSVPDSGQRPDSYILQGNVFLFFLTGFIFMDIISGYVLLCRLFRSVFILSLI